MGCIPENTIRGLVALLLAARKARGTHVRDLRVACRAVRESIVYFLVRDQEDPGRVPMSVALRVFSSTFESNTSILTHQREEVLYR